jgi:hypothetical protein
MPAAAVRAVAFWLGSFGFAVLPFSPAAAQSSSGSPLGDWLKQETMTGNWDGDRTRLELAGISVRGGYTKNPHTTRSAANSQRCAIRNSSTSEPTLILTGWRESPAERS